MANSKNLPMQQSGIGRDVNEEIYNKYRIHDGDGRFTLDGIDLKTIVNHPISAMRAELLEKLKAKI